MAMRTMQFGGRRVAPRQSDATRENETPGASAFRCSRIALLCRAAGFASPPTELITLCVSVTQWPVFLLPAIAQDALAPCHRPSSAHTKQPPRGIELVAVDGMPHAGINPLVDHRTERRQHLARFMHARQGNVRIDVAAAEEHRRAVERPAKETRRAGWTDQPATETNYRGVACRVASDILQRQTGSLRETE